MDKIDPQNAPEKPAIANKPNGKSNAESLVQQVVNGIIRGVERGRYSPGQRLIAADLADEFEVSRAPVREALALLAGEGVLDILPRRGAQIRRLSVDQLIDFLEFTEAICKLGIRRAIIHMHEDESQKRLNKRFDTIEDTAQRRTAPEFVNALYEYHETLNSLSGNTFLDMFYRRPYFAFFNRLVADLIPPDLSIWEQYIENYRRIHSSILNADAARADAAFVSHISWLLDLLRAN